MTIYTAYDLEQKGIKLSPLQNTLELDGITYTRGQTFALDCQELAERVCQSYIAEGYACFLVSANQMLTVWRGEKRAEVVPQTEEDNLATLDQSTAKDPSTPTERKLLYRGAPMDTTVPDLAQKGEPKPVFYRGAPVLQPEVSAEPPQKKKRTYRGVEY